MAKAEGDTAVIYGQSLDPRQISEFSARVSAYFGVPIKLDMISGLHPQKAAEVVQASKMGVKSGIDIFWTGSAVAVILDKGGVIAPFDWIKAFNLDKSLRLGRFGLRIHDGDLASVVYNTNLVKAADAPKSYEELGTDPRWKGRIAMPRAPNGFIYMSYAIGDAAARKLVTDLMNVQEVKILPSYPDVRNRVVTGEFAIGIGVDSILLRRSGAPIVTAPIDPMVLTPWAAWLMKDAQHPATGKLFAYWATTPDGQKTLSQILGISLVTTPGTELAEEAKGKKVVLVPHEFIADNLPKLLPIYSRLMGIR